MLSDRLADCLDRPQLSIVSRSEDPELARIRETIDGALVVDGRADLEAALCQLLAVGRPGVPKTLDLIGHSTATTCLLALGEFVIDASRTAVTAFFRGLAENDVPARLGIKAVRLLGCLTADTAHGKWTVCALADILGIEVYGATGLLLASHYGRGGFSDDRRYVIASSSELRANALVPKPLDLGEPSTLPLDIDAIPAMPLPQRAWPVRVFEREQARELLCLVRRRQGSVIPGLLAAPTCEVALPSAMRDRFHLMQVLFDGELVRVFPRGVEHGVVYPVDDAYELRKLVG